MGHIWGAKKRWVVCGDGAILTTLSRAPPWPCPSPKVSPKMARPLLLPQIPNSASRPLLHPSQLPPCPSVFINARGEWQWPPHSKSLPRTQLRQSRRLILCYNVNEDLLFYNGLARCNSNEHEIYFLTRRSTLLDFIYIEKSINTTVIQTSKNFNNKSIQGVQNCKCGKHEVGLVGRHGGGRRRRRRRHQLRPPPSPTWAQQQAQA